MREEGAEVGDGGRCRKTRSILGFHGERYEKPRDSAVCNSGIIRLTRKGVSLVRREAGRTARGNYVNVAMVWT